MNDFRSYDQLLKNLVAARAPAYILTDIEANIDKLLTRKNIIKGTIHATISCIAIFSLVLSFRYTTTAMIGSGFTSYISIIFTEGTNLLSSWKELGLVLIESLPVLSISAVVGLLAVSIYSLNKSILSIRNVRHTEFKY